MSHRRLRERRRCRSLRLGTCCHVWRSVHGLTRIEVPCVAGTGQGVARHTSLRLNTEWMYQTTPSLTTHVHHPSRRTMVKHAGQKAFRHRHMHLMYQLDHQLDHQLESYLASSLETQLPGRPGDTLGTHASVSPLAHVVRHAVTTVRPDPSSRPDAPPQGRMLIVLPANMLCPMVGRPSDNYGRCVAWRLNKYSALAWCTRTRRNLSANALTGGTFSLGACARPPWSAGPRLDVRSGGYMNCQLRVARSIQLDWTGIKLLTTYIGSCTGNQGCCETKGRSDRPSYLVLRKVGNSARGVRSDLANCNTPRKYVSTK